MTEASPLARFSDAAAAAAAQFIRSYSTSFLLATRLLPARKRTHVGNIYALVRTADEIVDGVCAEAGLDSSDLRRTLDAFEQETVRALRSGYSANPVIHAFALTARQCGICAGLVAPFFASMRADLQVREFDADQHRAYVYGSAEVVGLMCLRVFLWRAPPAPQAPVPEPELRVLEEGARALGAAFQNVNFLRDLAQDELRLGRSYLPALNAGGRLDEESKRWWVQRIARDLATARAAIPLLPPDSRLAVACAHDIFAALLRKIDRIAAPELYRRRLRISNGAKLLIAAGSALRLVAGSTR